MNRPSDERVQVSLPRDLAERLDTVAAASGIGRSQAARALLAAALPPIPPTAPEAPECPAR